MAISEVFQKMFFMIPLADLVLAKGKQFQCFVPIACPPDEELTLCLKVDQELALRLAENFLGLQCQDISESQSNSTVLEILNMVAGNFLNQIDPLGKYQLGIPVAGIPREGEVSICEEFNFESHSLVVLLRGFIS